MIVKTPWDTAALGINCYEITNTDGVDLNTLKMPGHYSVKVDPLADKSNLHQAGFYYCDTLLTTFCTQKSFRPYQDREVDTTDNCSVEDITEICALAFQHGRYHRDFNVSLSAAEERYRAWAESLFNAGSVTGLLYKNRLVGFIACQGSHLLLHAIKTEYRGKGLAKLLWTPVCAHLLNSGMPEVTSSISASNMPILNLYTKLGFSFKEPCDVYHKIVL